MGTFVLPVSWALTNPPPSPIHQYIKHYSSNVITIGFNFQLCQHIHHFEKLGTLPKSNVLLKCSNSSTGAPAEENLPHQNQDFELKDNFVKKWKANSGKMSAKLAKLGLAALLAYGIFDGVTYTTFFVLAFLGYEKSTGKNPAANLQALLGIVILMWTGNNITRPFRVAGAAALAPAIDNGLRRIQKHFNFPSPVYTFALVVGIVAASSLTVVGLLILSRWPGK